MGRSWSVDHVGFQDIYGKEHGTRNMVCFVFSVTCNSVCKNVRVICGITACYFQETLAQVAQSILIVKLATHSYPVPSSRTRGAIPPLPQYALWRVAQC